MSLNKPREWWLSAVASFLCLGSIGGCGLALVLAAAFADGLGILAAGIVTCLCLSLAEAAAERRVKVHIDRDSSGKPRKFGLSLGRESVMVEPGNTWIQTDQFKWVTRGLMDGPQSFRVSQDGTVEINGEKIRLVDEDACGRLEHELSKHYTAVAPKPATARDATKREAGPASQRVVFKVKLTHLGHLTIDCLRLDEHVETGLRGLPTLVENGLMLRPKSVHVHPLQQWVELDGVRYECTEAGAHALEETLNASYSPSIGGERAGIEIRENPAAATGFDIRFVTVRAGARFEIKGHLCQEHLDLLQDQERCDLLQPGIVIRLSPPNLIIRRKRSDGGEEHLSQFPDVQYRKITATQLEQILNHPMIRRGGAGTQNAVADSSDTLEFSALRVTHNKENKQYLWLECVPARGGQPVGRAFTHHNLADLRAAGVFLPHIEIALSLDNRTLSILNTQTKEEERLVLSTESPDADLLKAGRVLSAALTPPTPRATAQPDSASGLAGESDVRPPVRNAVATPFSAPSKLAPEPAVRRGQDAVAPPLVANQISAPIWRAPHEPAASPVVTRAQTSSGPAVKSPSAARTEQSPRPVASGGGSAPPIGIGPRTQEASPENPLAARFKGGITQEAYVEVFRRIGVRFGLPAQEIFLSLPRVFENRRFEVISFVDVAIESVLDLRGAEFYGFYLSHISGERIDFVYACRGRHLEWGHDKCVAQPALGAEPVEFKGSALLGMAQEGEVRFVFVVTPSYKNWIAPHAVAYEEACASFVTVSQLGATSEKYSIIWP